VGFGVISEEGQHYDKSFSQPQEKQCHIMAWSLYMLTLNHEGISRNMKIPTSLFCSIVVFTILILTRVVNAEPITTHEQGNFIKNGGFEHSINNRLSHWNTVGLVKPERVSGVWSTLTCKFNSGNQTEVIFCFLVEKGSTGSIWLDRIVGDGGLQAINSGFEEQTKDRHPAAWNQDNWGTAVFPDSSRASEGRKSLRVAFKNEVVPTTRIWQKISVKPNQDYQLSFDVFVGDDFQGEAKGLIFDAGFGACLLSNWGEPFASNLVADRDQCETGMAVLAATGQGTSEISQEIEIKPDMNLQARIDVHNKKFKGMVELAIEDPATGRVLRQTRIEKQQDIWQSMQVSFQSISTKLRVRLTAKGEGELRVDNVEVGNPLIIPSLQNVSWLPATENFLIASPLKVSVQGQNGLALEGGLELLTRDLEKHGIQVQKTDEDREASLRISIGPGFAIKDKDGEAYTLSINKRGISIKAGSEAGAFYGLMTLLQLLEKRGKSSVVLGCTIVDYPDMPIRGVMCYDDIEQVARWKMNTLMVSTGWPTSMEERERLRSFFLSCQKLNLKVVPYFITMEMGTHVERINPNLAAGVWVKDEKVTLKGNEPSFLANKFVIRTELTDVSLTSLDGKKRYKIGKDYQIVNGDMACPYDQLPDQQKIKPFAVARVEGSSIPDGATVLASYDYVTHNRSSNPHIAYCPLEPELEKLVGEFLKKLAKDYSFDYFNPSNDLMEFFVAELQLKTDSRLMKSGKSPIRLLAEHVCFQDKSAKSGNPKVRIFQWVGNVNEECKIARPLLPKDALINVWGYDASWPVAYGRDAVAFWSRAGFETSVMPWNNLRNVRGWAQVVAEARAKGYPCAGMIDSCWPETKVPNCNGGVMETAIVSWKIPKKGEKRFIALPAKRQ
jgi:hypothetical protein